MTEKELEQILKDHNHWIKEDCIGWEQMKANLRYVNLSGANLSGVDLSYANLSGANLSDVDLSNANLSNANLSNTNLSGADLSNTNLRYTDLSGVDLSNANLIGANLSNADPSNANLSGVDLSNANLRYTNLSGADLSNANLSNANLSNTNLSGANLSGAKNVPYIPMVCPEEGDFIGWKKASKKIVKLHIPKNALRSSATTRKCRCNKAEVVEIYNLDGTISEQRCVKSDYNNDFVYKVGETVSVDNYDEERWNECSTGIHFFLNRQEAINYG